MKNKNMKFKITLLLLFVMLAPALFYLLHLREKHTQEAHLNFLTDKYVRAYKTIYDQYKTLATNVSFGIIDRFDIVYVYEKLQHCTDEEKNRLRSKLLAQIKPRFEKMQQSGMISQIHFYLPNNETFLRIKRPEVFGESISETRPSVAYVNERHLPIDGFEIGKVYCGYRFIFPVTGSDNLHLGSMEIAFCPSLFTAALMKQYVVLSNFFVDEAIARKNVLPDEFEENFSKSHHFGYLYDKRVLEELKKVTRKEMKNLKPEKATTDKVYANAQSGRPMTLYDNAIKSTVTTIPVHNPVTGELTGIFTIRSESEFLAHLHDNFYLVYLLSLSLLGIFLSFFYVQISKRKILEEYSKNLEKQIKERTEKLLESEEKYRGIFNESIAAIYVFDSEKHFIDTNQAGLDLLGYSREELLNMAIPDVDADPNVVIPAHNQLLGGDRIINYEHRLVRKDGEIITVLNNSRPLTGSDGTVIGMQSTLIDITDRKLKEKERNAFLQEIKSIMETVPDIIYMIDLKGNLVNWNKALEDTTGYTKSELQGKTALELLHPEDKESVLQGIEEAYRFGKASREHRVLTKGGKAIPHFISGKVRKDENGNAIGLVGTAQNITDLKNLESRLRMAQKMETVGLMASGVAHDLNNILSGIVGYPDLLLEELPRDSDLRKPLEAILDSGNRATAIIADLLTVAKGVATKQEVTNLNVLIEEYLNSPEFETLKMSHPKVHFQCHLDTMRPDILCSPVHIQKNLINLLMNAAEAIIGEGTVTITTANKKIDNAAATQDLESGDYVVLRVQDTGPGIPDKDMEHIFEPFYSKKILGRSGTGLGLTIVWNTVQEQGGKLFVTSSAKGTLFDLYFPVIEDRKTATAGQKKTITAGGSGEHILVVDDEALLRDLASRMLQALGYRVDTVSSGEQAIDFIQNKPVDLVLLDMMMEPGLNGRQTYEAILKINPGQKAIIASGFSESEDVDAAMQQGAAGFIKKPYTKKQLSLVIRKALTA